ncbi:hypothetical protein I4F81_002122 [Pyropia yezoensis]|uniref:Uncharacterized protein n=1 Tax=Pyropia yezoensis TaxID=2788 RepID=A0ACC3BPY3_PYRYE|nr:hypothetical protein I4F81_002122 [Neopyropia yezoensis]
MALASPLRLPGRLSATLAATTAIVFAACGPAHLAAAASFRPPDLVGTFTLEETIIPPTPPPSGGALPPPPPVCGATITHRVWNALTNETFSSVPFDEILVGGEECDDSKSSAKDKLFCVAIGAAVAEAEEVTIPSGVLSIASATAGKALATQVRELIDRARTAGDAVVLCVDGEERECGDFESPANAAYAFLRVDEALEVSDPRGPNMPALFTLRPGRRQMIALTPEVGCVHADPAGVAPLVVVSTSAWGAPLALTPGHYLPLATAAADDARCTHHDGRCLVPARALVVGDALLAAATTAAPVAACNATAHPTVTRLGAGVSTTGLYAPHTASGWLVVDGLVVSAYTEAVPPAVAHAAVGVLRAAAVLGGGWQTLVAQGVLRVASVGGWVLGALDASS